MRNSLVRTLLALAILPLLAFGADVIIVNGDPAGVGFNDPTPATPVGGNPGTTVGQQALNVFQRAADRWGAKLVSRQPIYVIAFFTPLSCTATSGVLGAAGANWYFANIPNAKGGQGMLPDTWYPAALAEKLTNQDIVVDPTDPFEIFALFNSDLGKPGCLTGRGWYYGLDNKEPSTGIDLLAVVLHEFGHGLGFSVSPTSANSGSRAQGLPSVWERYLLDMTSGKRWIDMTSTERRASARNDLNLVWAGQHGTNEVTSVLDFRTEVEGINPTTLGVQEAQSAQFGPPIKGRNRGFVVAPSDGIGDPTDGCEPYPASSAAVIAGNYVLVNRGTCTFAQKVLNAQNAGAAAVLVANSVPAGFPSMSGADPNIFIPSVGITQAFGAALRSLATPPYVSLQVNPIVRAGTTQNYPRLYAPASFASGSSVSHWDVTATKNVLMEPFINTDLTSSVKNPEDLSKALLVDIGW